MEIGPLVKRNVLSVGPGTRLSETARLMAEAAVGAAIVTTEDGRPGIITERDLLRSMAQGVDPDDSVVEDFMTSAPITASPSWGVSEAATRMLEGGFRHLIVLGDNGQVEGILSIRDLVGSLLGRR